GSKQIREGRELVCYNVCGAAHMVPLVEGPDKPVKQEGRKLLEADQGADILVHDGPLLIADTLEDALESSRRELAYIGARQTAVHCCNDKGIGLVHYPPVYPVHVERAQKDDKGTLVA